AAFLDDDAPAPCCRLVEADQHLVQVGGERAGSDHLFLMGAQQARQRVAKQLVITGPGRGPVEMAGHTQPGPALQLGIDGVGSIAGLRAQGVPAQVGARLAGGAGAAGYAKAVTKPTGCESGCGCGVGHGSNSPWFEQSGKQRCSGSIAGNPSSRKAPAMSTGAALQVPLQWCSLTPRQLMPRHSWNIRNEGFRLSVRSARRSDRAVPARRTFGESAAAARAQERSLA